MRRHRAALEEGAFVVRRFFIGVAIGIYKCRHADAENEAGAGCVRRHRAFAVQRAAAEDATGATRRFADAGRGEIVGNGGALIFRRGVQQPHEEENAIIAVTKSA